VLTGGNSSCALEDDTLNGMVPDKADQGYPVITRDDN